MADTVTITTETPNPSLEESAAKLGIDPASVDSSATSQEAPTRPSWLPEGFNTPEDFAAAYEALKGQEKPAEGTTPEEGTETPTTETPETPEANPEVSEAEKAAGEAAEKSGLNLNDLSNAYWENGHLTDEQYASLEKGGYPKSMVDQFIAGQTAIRDTARNAAFAEVGGETAYDSMLEWAAGNLSEGEVKAYNTAVESADVEARMGAIRGLKARHQAAEGHEPARQVSGRTNAHVAPAYTSIAQMQEDMRSPKYKSDPAFRRMVADKLDRSDIM